MSPADLILRYPFLASPVHLMQCYRGKAYLPTPRHLWKLNDELMAFFNGPGGEWFVCNMPFRHAKTDTSSIGFPAWALFWNPDLQILVASHSEEFAREKIGSEIKKVIEAFGPELGIHLRADSKAKGRWNIEGHTGGVTCMGSTGKVGYPSDIYLVDDLVPGLEESLRPGTHEENWQFFMGTVFSRLTAKSKVALVGTRWAKRDIFGRVLTLARRSGKAIRHIRFPAFAVERDIDPATGCDIIGRRVGEPLWPEHVPVEQLEMARKNFGPFFDAGYQQAPTEEENSLFQPSKWPTFTDIDHAFRLNKTVRQNVLKNEVAPLVTVDWAYSEKKKADRTAILTVGLLPDGGILVLNCVCKRFAVEQGPKELAAVCAQVKPVLVGMEGHSAMALECRKYPAIGEPRQLQHQSKAKIVRAVQAIEMGMAGRIYLPDDDRPWLDDFKEELGAFTGIDDDHDDQCDALAWACKLVQELRGAGSTCDEPSVLIEAPSRNAYP